MKAVRRTVRWLVVILLLVAVGGGGYAYWWLTRSDELVRTTIQRRLAELSPDWEFSIGQARFDLRGRACVCARALTLHNTCPTLPQSGDTSDEEPPRKKGRVAVTVRRGSAWC